MLNSRRKLLLALFVVALCGLSASLHLSRAVAQQKPQAQASNAAEAPEVATRFSEVLRARNAKGSAVPLKVEIKEWNVTRADRAAEISDQGFYIVHLLSGEVTTEIAGKTTARNTGDFWTVEKGQHMAISLQRPQEQARLQTIAVSPGH
jgi:quercetin dioxygenase-like cupin family protein